MKAVSIPILSQKGLIFILIVLLLGLYSYSVPYVIWDSSAIGTILLAPYLVVLHHPRTYSWRFMGFCLGFLLLSWWLPHQNTPLFFAVVFALLFLVEMTIGKLHLFALWVIVLVSPLLRYLGTSFGFPIRLQLTSIAGECLHLLYEDVSIVGNLIELNGQEFSVDPACVGLKMISSSLLIGVFLMAHFQHQTRKYMPFWLSVVLIGGIMFFNILNNLLRILILVIFHVLPENPLHDFLGILSLVCYVIVPSYFLIRYSSRCFIAPYTSTITTVPVAPPKYYWRFVFIFLGIMLLGRGYHLRTTAIHEYPITMTLVGYHKEVLPNHTLKFTNSQSLVYVKALSNFYSAEHSPLFCWQGSGYSFQHQKKILIKQHEIYIGKLVKGQEVLYTAWWFSNGTDHTLHPIAWRWRSLQSSQRYYLVNVSTAQASQLTVEVQKLIP